MRAPAAEDQPPCPPMPLWRVLLSQLEATRELRAQQAAQAEEAPPGA